MICKRFESFEREREVRAALVVSNGVNFVDDDGFDRFENFATLRGGEQNIERFGGRDKNVRRPREHLAALVHQRIAGTHSSANLGQQEAALSCKLQNFAEWNLEVFLNVVAESFKRRNVKNFEPIGQLTRERFADEAVNTSGKRG